MHFASVSRMIPLGIAFFSLLFSASVADAQNASTCWKKTPCTGPKAPAFTGPWEKNVFAPATRIVQPKTVLSYPGLETISSNPGTASLKGNGSTLVFDFGFEVGGIVSIDYCASGPASLGLAFSEAKNWVGQWSDSSNGRFKAPDGAIYAEIMTPGPRHYVLPDEKLRGGFRYLTLFLKTTSNSTVQIKSIKTDLNFQPTWPNLQAYQGYFHSSDTLLNKIWYAGAYTLQTNSVPSNTGRHVWMTESWANNATMGPGPTILVDGAKRDRAVWPGDMGVAVPSIFVSTGEMDSVRNALQVMFDYQNKDGSLPEAGPPLLQQGSDTYQMWTLVGVYNYVLFTDDVGFVVKNWKGYKRALDYVVKLVQPENGLLNVTGIRDWARWQQGGFNAEANMILYHTLTTAASLTTWLPTSIHEARTLSSSYSAKADALKTNINKYLFDPAYGAYRDNTTLSTKLHPQDANSLALLYAIAPANSSSTISQNLMKNWTPIGPASPELPDNISPFITSFELAGHFTIGATARALDLLRRTWGWYLQHPNGTQSTLIEGYRTDGSFGYRMERGYGNDPSYVSHAHGWSSGPTSSLTQYVAGLRITERAGKKWGFSPQMGDLNFAEAGFMTKLGRFRAGWKLVDGGYDVEIETPEGTEGEVILPFVKKGQVPNVIVDGAVNVQAEVEWERVGDTLKAVIKGGKGLEGAVKTFAVR